MDGIPGNTSPSTLKPTASLKISSVRRAVFLTCCERQAYSLLRRLFAPGKPATAELSGIRDMHYSRKPSHVVSRFMFNTTVCQEGEAASDLIVAINFLSEDCEYGTFRDSTLRDRTVRAINDDAEMRKRLLELPELTLDLAWKTVIVIVAARKDPRTLSTGAQGTSANFIENNSAPITCYRCSDRHLANALSAS